MDDLLQIVGNKAGDDEVLLNWDLLQFGNYELVYRLQDDTITKVKIRLDVDKMGIDYGIFKESTGDSLVQNLVNLSYYEMDYSLNVPVLINTPPVIVDIGGENYIHKEILKTSTNKYSGISFKLNNIDVRVKWNPQLNTVHFYTQGVEAGKIIEFGLQTPDGDFRSLKALRRFEGFTARSTHWMHATAAPANEDLKTITMPSSDAAYKDETPGGRPGIHLEFKQPKAYNTTTRKYETLVNADLSAVMEIEDIMSKDYADFSFELSGSATNLSQTVKNPPNSGDDAGKNTNSQINYDPITSLYTVEIVQDKSTLLNPDPNKDQYLQWSKLSPSRIYNITMSLDQDPEYEFSTYSVEGSYGYTYVEYSVNRASLEDAYLLINPYANGDTGDTEYTVYYSKSKKTTFGPEDTWLTHYHSSNQTDTDIYIPVPFKEDSTAEYYQLGMNFAGKRLNSQTIEYKPVLDTNVPPTTPRITSIDNLAVVPSIDPNQALPEKVKFDMTWQAPTNVIGNTILDSMINSGVLYYELYANVNPQNSTIAPFNLIKQYKVIRDTISGKIQLVEESTGKAVGEPMNDNGFDNGYNKFTGEFGFKNIILRDNGTWTTDAIRTFDDVTKTYDVATGTLEHIFEYPGVNYLKMQAVYVKTSDGGIAQSEKSISASISLDVIKYEIPIPSDIKYTPVVPTAKGNPVGIDLVWYPLDIESYENFMLYPLDYEIKDIKYEVYIGTDRTKMTTLETSGAAAENVELGTFTNAEGTLSDADLQKLRSGTILKTSAIHEKDKFGVINYRFMGLDPNTNYYVAVKAILNVEDSLGVLSQEESSFSELNVVVSPVNPFDEPIDTQFPLAPESFSVKFVTDSKTSTELKWEFPSELNISEKIEFELIRFKDRSIPTQLDTKAITIDNIIGQMENLVLEPIAYRLYRNASGVYMLEEYNKVLKVWAPSTAIFKVEFNVVTLIDEGLSPNAIYYYYLRTSTRNLIENNASKWFPATITTAPIQAPMNLSVPLPVPTPYIADAKHEIYLKFDAGVGFDAVLGTDYRIEIFVKGEEDSEYVQNKYLTTFLQKNRATNDAYTSMLYKISGLKSGKSYSIKVRMVDMTRNPELSPSGLWIYPTSDFSDRIVTRTDFDQDEFDKEQLNNKYLDYYDSQVNLTKNNIYWIIEDADGKYTVKYRGDHSEGQVEALRNGVLSLINKNTTTLTYYIPSQMLVSLNANNTTLDVQNALMKLNIRANTITQNTTQELKEAISLINQYNSTYDDYAIKMIITKGAYTGKINGTSPESELIDIQFKVVPINNREFLIDNILLQDLDYVNSLNRSLLITKLIQELSKGISEAALAEITKGYVEKFKTELMGRQLNTVKSHYIKETTISKIEKGMNLSWKFQPSSLDLSAYYRTGSTFTEMLLYQQSGLYSVNADKVGSYIIAGLVGSNITQYSVEVNDMISKYGLLDYFSLSELSNPSYKPNKNQITGAIARLIGANKADDAITYLKSKGIGPLNSLNLYLPLAKQNALYLMAQAYEIKKVMSLDSVYIKNYNAIKDLSSVSLEYRKKLLAAEQLGLLATNDGYLSPTNTITVKEMLDFLVNMK
jgi:hypothetical protein